MDETERLQYYKTLEARFDQAARQYDVQFGPPSGSRPGNPLVTWLYDEHYTILRDLLPDGALVLDIGCGTGEDALRLAQVDYTVLGVDVSPAMVRQAQTKAAAFGLSRQTVFKVLPAGKLASLEERGPFQGAFASLGTLNTESDLAGVAAALHELLEPGAPFVATVMSRHCWFEIRHNLRRLKPGETLKRGGTWAETRAGTGGVIAPVMFYTPQKFADLFAPFFAVEQVMAFPLLLPPVHMHDLYREQEAKFKQLLPRERRLRTRAGFRAWGDHFLMILRHQPGTE